jgi:hypothetical protein
MCRAWARGESIKLAHSTSQLFEVQEDIWEAASAAESLAKSYLLICLRGILPPARRRRAFKGVDATEHIWWHYCLICIIEEILDNHIAIAYLEIA